MGDETNYSTMEKEALIKRILTLEDEVEQLKKELVIYKNPNTPPSSNKHIKPNTNGIQSKEGAKRGAPNGHKGTTRNQEANRKMLVDAQSCPNCNSMRVVDKTIHKRVVDEIVEFPEPETIEAEIHEKECKDCGLVFIPRDNTIPLQGKFGINIMVLVILIKFVLRGVLRKTASFLDDGFALKMTPATVNAIVKRVANAADMEYAKMKERIRIADKIYVDETSFSVLGINQWVWVFRTSQDILLVIRPSRGSNVLEEILGKSYAGTVICDCWRAYNFLSNAHIQRCWAHLLRKSKDLSDSNSIVGRHFHEKLKALFEEIKTFNASNPMQEQRNTKYKAMTRELKKLTTYYSRYDSLTGVVKYINFNLANWFTCVKIAGIEPTNNFAEQAIRETVMVRKIIGAFRSETGKENYEILASLIASWQLKDMDIQEELRSMLVRNLCLS